jgi:hypothetical protein
MSLNFSKIGEEHLFSVGILEVVREGDAVAGLPALEAGDLGSLLVPEQDGSGADESDEGSNQLSVHESNMKST